jgi:phage tail tape-measure protein
MPQKQNEEIGNLSGIGAGVLAGAALGSAVLPVIGTFAGALAGGLLGSQVGRTFGGAILDALEGQPTEPAAAPNVIDQLERLGQLRTQGLITEEEFAAAKAKILGQ